jgi:hypothetical protein
MSPRTPVRRRAGGVSVKLVVQSLGRCRHPRRIHSSGPGPGLGVVSTTISRAARGRPLHGPLWLCHGWIRRWRCQGRKVGFVLLARVRWPRAWDSRVGRLKAGATSNVPLSHAREGDICWCSSWCVYRESSSVSTAVTVTDSSREPKHPSLLLKKKNKRFGSLLVRVEMRCPSWRVVRRSRCCGCRRRSSHGFRPWRCRGQSCSRSSGR